MKLVQCWDDGVVDDIRLIEILRRHGAKASFNLNFGTLPQKREGGWKFREIKEVFRLAVPEVKSVYDGFLVANHSLTHPWLDRIEPEIAERDIREGRDQLEQHFGYAVTGFAYPYGGFNPAVQKIVRKSGHVYARTGRNVEQVFPPVDAMAFHPNCHFLAPDFWDRFEKAGDVFYFWGHSYELITPDDWTNFERKIERLSTHPETQWTSLPDLFA
jgi:peptidoglycan/xylan/chitin deacetylase (PgdA/CDA1 family)